MPHTLPYRPLIIDTLTSTHRLTSYENVFQTTNDIELMGVYLWSQHISGVLYPLLSCVEVSLRNAIDRALTQKLGLFWWRQDVLRCKAELKGRPATRPLIAIRENFDSANRAYIRDMKEILGKHAIIPNATHHDLIARTEFSTWEFLFDHQDYQFLDHQLIWPGQLSNVFLGAWPHTSTKQMVQHVGQQIKQVRLFRNRLAHHEPIWKRYGVGNEADAIQSIHDRIATIESLIKLIHPEYHRMLIVNGLVPSAYRAASSSEIRRFQHLARVEKINSKRKLKRLVSEATNSDKIIQATVHSNRHRRFLITPY